MKRAAGKVTDAERRLVRLHDKDRLAVERLGVPRAARIGFRLQRDVLAAVRRGARWPDVREIIRRAMDQISRLALDGMILAHLSGTARGLEADRPVTLSLDLAPYDEAIARLRRRLRLTAGVLADLGEKFRPWLFRVTQKTTMAVERQIQQALIETTESGEHVREGVKALRQAFADAGITPQNSFTLENVFRTQTQMAYGAGRWQAGQDEAIQEILWGYKYVTVGDDRVRPEHVGLDGVTAPKDDGIWSRIWPPNGFACRCSTIEVFTERKIVHPSASVEVDGKEYTPGPDKGFEFNPGQQFAPAAT